jgi:2-methylaconitate cis-trans-isomerase PrpF
MMKVAIEAGALEVSRAAIVRTARKLFEGRVFPRTAP